MSGYATLDVLQPYAGPCAICGGPDKRHRLADALVSYYRGGDSVILLARTYELPESSVQAIVDTAERNRRRKKHRWAA